MYRFTPWEMQHHPFMHPCVRLRCSSTGAAGGFVPGSRTARWWMNEAGVSFAPARYFQTYCALEPNSPWQQNCCFYLLYCTSITRTLHCLGLIICPDSVGLLAQNMINCSLLIDFCFYTLCFWTLFYYFSLLFTMATSSFSLTKLLLILTKYFQCCTLKMKTAVLFKTHLFKWVFSFF